MRILITGGAGFIGSHLADQYLALGHEVILVDNLSTGQEKNINPQAKFYLLNISSPELEKVFALEKPDLVNHHAAQVSVPLSVRDPFTDLDTNAKGTLNILENCVKYQTQKIIFISSGGAIYGEANEYPTSENYLPHPLSPYGIHKYLSELYIFYYHQTSAINYTILRYANVYGPRQVPHGEAGVVSIFIEQLLANTTPFLYAYPDTPDGMIRDYIFVDDVIRANVLALKRGDNQTINIGTGIATTTGQLLREIARQLKKPYQPLLGIQRPGDIKQSCLQVSHAEQELGWRAEFSLAEGIQQTIRYYQA